MTDLLYLDTETTGLNFQTAQVVELAYAIGPGDIKTLVLPHTLQGAEPKALEINKYYERGLDDRSRWATEAEIGAAVAEMTGRTLLAANPRFDSRMLERTFGFVGNQEPWHYRLFDIQSFAAGVLGLPTPIGMAALYSVLVDMGYELPKPDHTAAGDVATLRAVHEHLTALQAGHREAYEWHKAVG